MYKFLSTTYDESCLAISRSCSVCCRMPFSSPVSISYNRPPPITVSALPDIFDVLCSERIEFSCPFYQMSTLFHLGTYFSAATCDACLILLHRCITHCRPALPVYNKIFNSSKFSHYFICIV